MSQTTTTGPTLQIDSEVTRSIRQHARAHMKTEVCGVLIGEQREAIVEVSAMIEAHQAAQAGTHVTFTQDAWEEIYKVKDRDYPDARIVGWYHSHPGFGVFLSEHDTFIHKNFFSSPNQVAWVFDPHTDEEGCFGWFDGEIQRIPVLSVLDLNGNGIERTPKERLHEEAEEDEQPRIAQPARVAQRPLWQRALVSSVSYALVAVVAFYIAIYLFPTYLAVAFDPRSGEPMMIEGRPVVLGRIRTDPISMLRALISPDTNKMSVPAIPAPSTSPASPAPARSTP